MCMVAGTKGDTNVVYDHLSNVINAMRPVHQVSPQCRGSDIGHMLVLGDGGNFRLGQSTHRHAIF